MIKLVERNLQTPYTHAGIKDIFSKNKVIGLKDITSM
jgi:hypothetical protein